MEFGEYWSKFFDELTTRGALSAGISATAFFSLITWWVLKNRKVLRQIQAVPIRILVTGSRGKSTVVRLLHASLMANGLNTYAKTTGTAASEIDVTGKETATRRIGQVSILEILESSKRAFAAEPKPDALVIECMAVSPVLMQILGKFMLKPSILVITNALFDHLEEQGKTREEIANSLYAAIATETTHVVTADPHLTNHEVYRANTTSHGAELVMTSSENVSKTIKQSLPIQHPANIAMTLAVIDNLGLDQDKALSGMQSATVEPHDREVQQISIDSRSLTFYDLGSINDTDSLPANLEKVFKQKSSDRVLIALLVNRWDRPLRALQFSENITPELFDGVIIVGQPFYPSRRILLNNGFVASQVLRLGSSDRYSSQWQMYVLELALSLNKDFKEAVIVLFENIHDPLADVMREELSHEHS